MIFCAMVGDSNIDHRDDEEIWTFFIWRKVIIFQHGNFIETLDPS